MDSQQIPRWHSGDLLLGWLSISFSVQPLANVIGYYTRRDRNNERDCDMSHGIHLLSEKEIDNGDIIQNLSL